MEKGQERLDFARLIKRCAVGPRMFCSDAGADRGFQQATSCRGLSGGNASSKRSCARCVAECALAISRRPATHRGFVFNLSGVTPADFAIVARKASVLGERDPRILTHWLETEAQATECTPAKDRLPTTTSCSNTPAARASPSTRRAQGHDRSGVAL
jgi:hypothetical protein